MGDKGGAGRGPYADLCSKKCFAACSTKTSTCKIAAGGHSPAGLRGVARQTLSVASAPPDVVFPSQAAAARHQYRSCSAD